MSRSGYSEDWDNDWDLIMWRGAVTSAMRGRRGQEFLKEMLAALDAMENKSLVSSELELDGAVCALGAVGKKRGMNMTTIEPEDNARFVGKVFGIAHAMAAEIMYENDEASWYGETPEQRWSRMRGWVASQIFQETGHDGN